MQDEALVAAAEAGDREALDRLLRSQVDRIHAVCRRLTGNEADAADATQEALIAVVRGLPRFDGRSSFSTWAYRVATNAALDELRRRARRPVTGLDEHTADAGGVAHQVGRADRAGAPALEVTVTDRLTLEEALARLPREYREAVVLRDVGDLDYEEIARTLGIPPGTVRSRIARGRSALARLLDGNPTATGERPSRQP